VPPTTAPTTQAQVLPTVLVGDQQGTRLEPTGDGRILFPVNDGSTGGPIAGPAALLGEVHVPQQVLSAIPEGTRLKVAQDPAPRLAEVNDAANGSLGGGAALRLAGPMDLRISLEDIHTGQERPVPDPMKSARR
jgi:hypothetical protein